MFKKISIFLILVLAIFLRSYHLESLPPALFSDEVDAGYQALVFNQNHTDYYGNKFPIHFHSFSDWRTSLYIYSISFFQSITHNSDLAIRLPSVVFSVVSVYFFYLLTGSGLAAFLLAINPWSIHYGRTGFEVSGMIMTILGGLYFWKNYTRFSRFKDLILSVLFFAVSPYFYSTSKLFLIIFALLILVIWFSKIQKTKLLHLILAVIFGLILLIPLTIDTVKGHAGFRFSYINIFSDPQLSKNIDNLRYQDIYATHQNETGVATTFSSKIFHNKFSLVFGKFISNYFSSFSTDFLFINGDENPRHGFGTSGLLYFIDFFLIFFGLVNVIKNRHQDKLGLFFVWVLIFAPIPFALTRDSNGPHATRLILMLPSLIFLAYQGILYLKFISRWFLPIIWFTYLISFSSFWHYYNYDYPQQSAMSWHTGIKEAVLASKKYQLPTYFSNSFESVLPFFLYYQPYLPKQTPTDGIKHINSNFIDGTVVDNNYYFGYLNWSSLPDIKTPSLFVVPGVGNNVVPKNLKLLEKIDKKYMEGQDFYIYTNEN